MLVCGKLLNFNPQHPADSYWPWLVAIYRRSGQDQAEKLGKVTSLGKDERQMYKEDDMSLENWQLVCSGALLNQRSLVVAAHCVTDLGKVYPLDVSKIRVVLGKHYRSDLHQTKSLQHLRVRNEFKGGCGNEYRHCETRCNNSDKNLFHFITLLFALAQAFEGAFFACFHKFCLYF